MLLAPVHHPTSTLEDMNMMANINHPAVADDEAGVEIIPTTAAANKESSNALVDAAAPPKSKAKSWMTKKVFIGIGALCVTGGGVYFFAGSGSPTSSKTTSFSSSNQMEQAAKAKEDGYNYGLFGEGGFCANSEGEMYPVVIYFGGSSLDECKEKCSECPGNCENGLGLVLRGIDYLGPSNCRCLVDFGIGFDETVCEGAGYADDGTSADGLGRGTFVGSGDIAMLDTVGPPGGRGAARNQCWKVSSKGSKVKSRNCDGTKASRKPKSSKRPVRKLGQDSLNNMEGKTDSQTVSE